MARRLINGWSILPDNKKPTTNLEEFFWHVRNAVAHGRLEFTSDSPFLSEVMVKVADKPRGKDKNGNEKEINWRAEIHGSHLREFCMGFLAHLKDVTA